MGLLIEEYEFMTGAPGYALIWTKTCEIHGKEIDKSIKDNMDLRQADDAERQRRTETRVSVPLSHTSAEFTDRRSRVELALSLQGNKIFIFGYHCRLFEATGKALEALGGVKRQPPQKKMVRGSKGL